MENKRINLEITYACKNPGECKNNKRCHDCPHSEVLKVKEEKTHTKTERFKLNLFRIVNYFGSYFILR